MIAKSLQSNLPVALAPQWRNFVEREDIAGRLVREAIDIEDFYTVPGAQAGLQLVGKRLRIRGHCDRFWCQQTCCLMVSVTAVHTTPVVDHEVRTKSANHAHHVVQELVAPDILGLFGRLRKTKILRAGEVELHSVAARCRQQLLGPYNTKLRSLLGPERILSAF